MPVWVWIAIAACLFNVFKPVHMDDAAYVQVAAALVENPRHAMRVLVNWDNVPEPISQINQPHGVPAFLALPMAMGLRSDLALHIAFALFTIVATAAFYRLARLCDIRDPAAVTFAFVLGPQFLPGQNLMTDVPMLAMMLLTLVWCRRGAWTAAGLAASVACLMKYNGIVLLPALVVIAWRARTRRAWLIVGIPAIALVAWSAFNLLDYGHVHILGRPRPTLTGAEWLGRIAGMLIGVGAVTPVTAVALFHPHRYRTHLLWATAATLVCVVVGWLITRESFPATDSATWLRGLFFGNGVLAILLAMSHRDRMPFERDQGRPLAVLATSTAIFVIGWAPFLAVRYLFPISVVVTLFIAYGHLDRLSQFNRLAVSCVAAGLGAALAMSDMVYAGTYRQMATTVSGDLVPARSTRGAYTAGHWGWQWYTTQLGLTPYATGLTALRPDDVIVVPCGVAKQRFSDADRRQLMIVSRYEVSSSWWTRVRTMGVQNGTIHSGYYRSSDLALPWFISRRPLDTFLVLSVTSAPSAPFDVEASCEGQRDR